MTSTARSTIRRRLGILIAGAVVVTALTAATVAAAPPAPMAAPAAGPGEPQRLAGEGRGRRRHSATNSSPSPTRNPGSAAARSDGGWVAPMSR